MEQLLAILNSLHPDVDFTTAAGLIENGILDSLDIVTLVTEINDAFDVSVPVQEIVPENFDSAASLWALIERLDED